MSYSTRQDSINLGFYNAVTLSVGEHCTLKGQNNLQQDKFERAHKWNLCAAERKQLAITSFIYLFVCLFYLWQHWGLNSCLLGRHSSAWATPPALFCDRYFRDRVLWTICPGWLQMWSSWSLPPELLRLRVWTTGTQLHFFLKSEGKQELIVSFLEYQAGSSKRT
jgi:hypothetical protein